MIGIYCIENKINKKKYIGESLDISKRWKTHLSHLNGNIHINKHLQYSWNKYGEENFIFYILECCDEECLDNREDFWVKNYNTTNKNFGFNKRDGGGSKGKLTQETKNKIGIANKKNPPTKKCLQASLLSRIGKPLSENHKNKLREKSTGKLHTEETKKRLSEIITGRKHSEESLELMREIKKGENNPNFGKKRKNASSSFFGVSYRKSRNKWVVQTVVNNKQHFLGYFNTEFDAAKAYDCFIIENKANNPLNFGIEKEIIYDRNSP